MMTMSQALALQVKWQLTNKPQVNTTTWEIRGNEVRLRLRTCNPLSPIHLSSSVVQVNATTFQDRRENMYPFFRRVDASREAASV